MTPRREPVEWVGAVAIFAPTGTNPYYRLKWREPDGLTGDTTGGRALSDARLKAGDIDDRLTLAAGPQATMPLTVLTDAFVAHARSPYGEQKKWKKGYTVQVRIALDRMMRGRRQLRAMDVTREVCDAMRAEAGTSNGVSANTTILRSFLLWGAGHQPPYFTPEQAAFLPKGGTKPQPGRRGTKAPSRREAVREVGSSWEFVTEEDAASAEEIARLADRLAVLVPAWGALAPEVAANCGLRWGEQFQLAAPDVHVLGCARQSDPHIHVNWQIDSGARVKNGDPRRCRPKGDKTRFAPIPRTSITGFPLRESLVARAEQAMAEQERGTNPTALLFPAPRGGLWWHSAFEADLLLPAMREAGWPLIDWTEVRDQWCEKEGRYRLRTTQRTTAVRPWHSLRHRFARTLVDAGTPPGELMALGGWENEETVSQRYYRSGEEHTTRGLARFA